MREITVGIGRRTHRSADGGTRWVESLREVPPKHTPIVRGAVDLARLPGRPRETVWDLVAILPDGFGVAVDHELAPASPSRPNEPSALAHVFRTRDGGRTWHEPELKPRWKLRQILRRATLSWPVEEFASLVLSPPATVVLTWEDPWIHDGARSHVILSRDGGESWRYHGLGSTNLVADGSGRLLALNDGFLLESLDGGAEWARRELAIEWPTGHRQAGNLLRHAVFVDPSSAYALLVHWRCGASFAPSHVGLLRTTDGGSLWRHVQVFDGPDAGDVNERHVLTLDVR